MNTHSQRPLTRALFAVLIAGAAASSHAAGELAGIPSTVINPARDALAGVRAIYASRALNPQPLPPRAYFPGRDISIGSDRMLNPQPLPPRRVLFMRQFVLR